MEKCENLNESKSCKDAMYERSPYRRCRWTGNVCEKLPDDKVFTTTYGITQGQYDEYAKDKKKFMEYYGTDPETVQNNISQLSRSFDNYHDVRNTLSNIEKNYDNCDDIQFENVCKDMRHYNTPFRKCKWDMQNKQCKPLKNRIFQTTYQLTNDEMKNLSANDIFNTYEVNPYLIDDQSLNRLMNARKSLSRSISPMRSSPIRSSPTRSLIRSPRRG